MTDSVVYILFLFNHLRQTIVYLPSQVKLDALANVKSSFFTGISPGNSYKSGMKIVICIPVDITQSSKAETIATTEFKNLSYVLNDRNNKQCSL